jgi:hypothetical protein
LSPIRLLVTIGDFGTIKVLNQGPYTAIALGSMERAAAAAIQSTQMQEKIVSTFLTDTPSTTLTCMATELERGAAANFTVFGE